MHTSPTPISLLPLETPHPVAARQEEGAVHVITQTIYRPSTTFVTYVTLGSGPPTSNLDRGNPAEPPPAAASPTVAREPPPDRSSGSLSSVQIGGILGGIVAFVAIALIAWFCVSQKPRRRPYTDDIGPYSDYDTSTEGNSTPTRRSRPRSQGGGRIRVPTYIPMPTPPPPVINVNRYKSWNPTFNGPPRRQQPPPPHRYRTRLP
ncbi:hypothetical protein CDEST_01749 [Colletotrichum destructivum]|uniref:Uncharacterized protein n=1 Tax=Colletotrichum destructivum TaxID=34406 RepID=A0AAX4I049_9PEZI|nr:hypothetical protein CDEST_01749 [Colletotrichum destructivum]